MASGEVAISSILSRTFAFTFASVMEICAVRANKAGSNDHAPLVASLLSECLGKGAHSVP
jgi:hypothetical protein